MEIGTQIIPAIRHFKNFEKALSSSHEWIVFLETRLEQLKNLVAHSRKHNKKVLIHIDLIQGLKADVYGVEYLVREIKPDGIVTTRGSVIEAVKKHKILAVQRLFLLDSQSLKNNVQQSSRYKPDYMEVLPGNMSKTIKQIAASVAIPIIAGGLVTTQAEVDEAIQAGAVAVSTSCIDLWSFEK